MVTFDDVSKEYAGALAVDRLSLEVAAGEFVVLIGPSGCGKTTSLKMVNRLIEPTSGTIYINGKDVRGIDPVKLRREIGYVIQQVGLFPNMTVEQNVDVVPRLLGWGRDKMAARVEDLLELVGMSYEEHAHRYPSELSGGQQQRIGVLRALAADPPLILMDEPFGALDPITRESLQNELKSLQAKVHKTIIFVTHDMDEALKLADRIVLMRAGQVVQVAPPEKLLRHPADDFVVEFLGKHRMEQVALDLVEDVMLPDPVTIQPQRGVVEGVALMKRKRVDTLLVADEGGRYMGAVFIEDLDGEKRKARVIQDLMRDAPAVRLGTPAREAFSKLVADRLRYLPVLDGEERLVGIVTRTSMVNAMADVVWGDS